jgi:hypothetical protein
MNNNNKTPLDAFRRVYAIRGSSMAGAPTEAYLIALRATLLDWAEDIKVQIARKQTRELDDEL